MNDTTYVCAQSLTIFLLAEENMLFAISIILAIKIVFKTNKYYGVYAYGLIHAIIRNTSK